jgi:hypothetical protein
MGSFTFIKIRNRNSEQVPFYISRLPILKIRFTVLTSTIPLSEPNVRLA